MGAVIEQGSSAVQQPFRVKGATYTMNIFLNLMIQKIDFIKERSSTYLLSNGETSTVKLFEYFCVLIIV